MDDFFAEMAALIFISMLVVSGVAVVGGILYGISLLLI